MVPLPKATGEREWVEKKSENSVDAAGWWKAVAWLTFLHYGNLLQSCQRTFLNERERPNITVEEKRMSQSNCLKIHRGNFPLFLSHCPSQPPFNSSHVRVSMCYKQTLLIYIVQKTSRKFNLMLILFFEKKPTTLFGRC